MCRHFAQHNIVRGRRKFSLQCNVKKQLHMKTMTLSQKSWSLPVGMSPATCRLHMPNKSINTLIFYSRVTGAACGVDEKSKYVLGHGDTSLMWGSSDPGAGQEYIYSIFHLRVHIARMA